MFNFNGDEEGVMTGDRINIVFTLDVNEYMGRKKLSINVKDYCYAGDIQNQLEYLNDCYDKIENLPQNKIEGILPVREECIPLYRMLTTLCGDNEKTVGYRTLIGKNGTLTEYLKMRIILDMFSDSGLIVRSYSDLEKVKIRIRKTDKKTDIFGSDTYKKLKNIV